MSDCALAGRKLRQGKETPKRCHFLLHHFGRQPSFLKKIFFVGLRFEVDLVFPCAWEQVPVDVVNFPIILRKEWTQILSDIASHAGQRRKDSCLKPNDSIKQFLTFLWSQF